MDGVLYYVTIPHDPPDPNLLEDDECSAGGDHEPQYEDASSSGNFWGEPVLEKRTIASCLKCGEDMALPVPDDDIN